MSTTKFVKNSLIYIIVSVLQKAILFFLLPLYTAFLTPEDFGVLNVVLSISAFLSVLFLLSLNGAATRFHYNHPDDELKISNLWGTLTTFVIINSVILGVVFILFHRIILDPFAKGIDFYPYLLLGIVSTILSPLYLFYQSYLQTKQHGVRFGINLILNFLLNIGLVILFVVILKKGVLGILLANVITALVFFIYVIIAYIPKIKLGLSRDILKPSFKYSLPLVPHSLSAWFTMMVDRILVNNMAGKVETGIYSVGYQFGNIVNIFDSAVNQAYIPWFFEKEKLGVDGHQQIKKVAELLTIVYCFLATGISLFSKEVLRFMVTEEFQNAWKVIPFICFAYVFNGLYFFFVNILFLNKTKFVPIVTFSSAAISVCLNLILIPKLGGFGAGISCLVSIFFASVISLVLSQTSNKQIRFHWKRMFLIVLFFMIISSTVYIKINASFLLILSVKVLTYSFLIFLFYFFYKSEINILRSIFLRKNGTNRSVSGD
jgi:O-antigen/teichoic acid export membrane protein